jgi:AraC-like DNA-binding protein
MPPRDGHCRVPEDALVHDRGVSHAQIPSTAGALARLACARAKASGLELQPLLREAGLTLPQIEDTRVRLKVRDQIRLLNILADALKDDYLGFHLALHCDLREAGMLYYIFASSQTFGEGLELTSRYTSIANEGMAQTSLAAGRVGVSYRYVGISRHQDRHQVEFWMTALVRACRHLTGLHIVANRIRLTHFREQGRGEFSEFFGRNIQFGAPADDIAFAASAGGLPIVSADPYLNNLLISSCEEATSHRPRVSGTFRLNVENILVPLLPHGKAQAGEIARRMGVSKRTMARRLSAEGLTFPELLKNLRMDLGKHYFARKDLSISQIAWLLGYHEVAAFSHAFKRWTGRTPREMRLGLRLGP